MTKKTQDQSLEERSAYILIEYYNNNLKPYFDAMDKDFLWLGPSRGQWVYGKENLKEMYAQENHNLKFEIGEMTTSMRMMGSSVCEVIVSFDLTTRYPDNEIVYVRERVQFTWEKKRISDKKGEVSKEWKWMTCHISDEHLKDPRDSIYPVHLNEYLIDSEAQSARERRIILSDVDNVTHYIVDATVTWIENIGAHSIVHTNDGKTIECKNTVNEIHKLYPKKFYRPHISFLINLNYVVSITRFEIKMTDNTIVPVPEKKYTKVKKDITDFLDILKSGKAT